VRPSQHFGKIFRVSNRIINHGPQLLLISVALVQQSLEPERRPLKIVLVELLLRHVRLDESLIVDRELLCKIAHDRAFQCRVQRKFVQQYADAIYVASIRSLSQCEPTQLQQTLLAFIDGSLRAGEIETQGRTGYSNVFLICPLEQETGNQEQVNGSAVFGKFFG